MSDFGTTRWEKSEGTRNQGPNMAVKQSNIDLSSLQRRSIMKKDTPAAKETIVEAKKPYHSPQLDTYGTVRELALDGTEGGVDDGGTGNYMPSV